MKAYMLDRDDVRQAMRVILDVSKELQMEEIILFLQREPAQRTEIRLPHSKAEAFKAATKAKCPVVPVALIDSFKPFDTNTISL